MSDLIRDILPPIALRFLRGLRTPSNRFEGRYENWQKAAEKCSGYDSENILDKVLAATLKVKRGEALFERDSVLFNEVEYAWPVLTGLMWGAARNKGYLRVLDFGGALGSSYFQNRRFFNTLLGVQWNVVEQSHYVEAGQRFIQNDELRFYSSIESCLASFSPNVILLSGVLQYLPDPFMILDQLSQCDAKIMIIDRTSFSEEDADSIVIQHVPSSIYRASYPMWIFSKRLFLDKVLTNGNCVASSICPEGKLTTTKNSVFSFEGMLLDLKS